jgi:large subunit ribosomal protein L10
MNRSEKKAVIDNLHEEFGRSPHAVLVDFRGLSVPAVTEFRRRVRRAGSRYRVVKNTLAKRAAAGTPIEQLSESFVETTGIAYTSADPVALAKVLVDFMKDNPSLVVKAGLVAGTQRLDAAGVKALSTMPGLPEMRARLLGLLQTPATQLVRLFSTPPSQLARVLKAHEEKLAGPA